MKYKSCGSVVSDWVSHMTERVCRSMLAADASYLTAAMEITELVAMLWCEFRLGVRCDLRCSPRCMECVTRAWAIDDVSMCDHLVKESLSASKDKRMASEAALLNETLAKLAAHLQWIDSSKSVADVLTKPSVDDCKAGLGAGSTCGGREWKIVVKNDEGVRCR